METTYCQSCGMPLSKEEEWGTEADGGKNREYCAYCYQNGAFTDSRTMEEMIDFCLDMTKDMGIYTNRQEAKNQMLEYFPQLKRWRK